ncbi:hypothetical protein J7J13_00610 [bacterium]|nr:hypothetical protein [bacterium]
MDYPGVSRKKEPKKISTDKVVSEEKSREVDCIRKDIHPKKDGSEKEEIGIISRGVSIH